MGERAGIEAAAVSLAVFVFILLDHKVSMMKTAIDFSGHSS